MSHNKPRLLDTFCCAGGTTRGYQLAGFEVVGVDIAPQKHYIGEHFIQANALDVLYAFAHGDCWDDTDGHLWHLEDFAAIHASPPCQAFSKTRSMRRKYAEEHYIDLLTPTRAALASFPVQIPWVIENVPGAPGPWDIRLCGTMFGLRGRSPVHRHRYFQASFQLPLPPFACSHTERAMNVYSSGPARNGTEREFCDAIGVTWGNVDEGMEAIPPAYTEFIGKQLMAFLRQEKAVG